MTYGSSSYGSKAFGEPSSAFVAAPPAADASSGLSAPFAPGQFLTLPDQRYLEAAASEALYSKCILQVSSQLQDGQGGYQEDYLNTYLDIPCRLMRGSGTGGSLGAGRTTNRRAILTLLASQRVTEDMRVWIDGVVWEVVRVHRPSTFATVQRVVVRRTD